MARFCLFDGNAGVNRFSDRFAVITIEDHWRRNDTSESRKCRLRGGICVCCSTPVFYSRLARDCQRRTKTWKLAMTRYGLMGRHRKVPRSDVEWGSCASAHRGSQGFAGSLVPEPGPVPLAAACGNSSHRSLVDSKERRFSEATLSRPLARRSAVVLELKESRLVLPRCFSLLSAKLQYVSP